MASENAVESENIAGIGGGEGRAPRDDGAFGRVRAVRKPRAVRARFDTRSVGSGAEAAAAAAAPAESVPRLVLAVPSASGLVERVAAKCRLSGFGGDNRELKACAADPEFCERPEAAEYEVVARLDRWSTPLSARTCGAGVSDLEVEAVAAVTVEREGGSRGDRNTSDGLLEAGDKAATDSGELSGLEGS